MYVCRCLCIYLFKRIQSLHTLYSGDGIYFVTVTGSSLSNSSSLDAAPLAQTSCGSSPSSSPASPRWQTDSLLRELPQFIVPALPNGSDDILGFICPSCRYRDQQPRAVSGRHRRSVRDTECLSPRGANRRFYPLSF